MRDLEPPFQFDLAALLQKARRTFQKRVEGVSISLPFVSFSVRPEDREKRVAREVVIRLADRRVLNASECCDGCIEQALASLQEIRSQLVDRQVELADLTDGALYLLLDLMREGIRQFLTFEQQIGAQDRSPRPSERHRERDVQQLYFAALEALRAHLHRCLIQVAAIAEMEVPGIASPMRYDPAWPSKRTFRPRFRSDSRRSEWRLEQPLRACFAPGCGPCSAAEGGGVGARDS